MAPDEYQTLLWDPRLLCLGLLLKQLQACTTIDMSNIRPLKVKARFLVVCISCNVRVGVIELYSRIP